MDVIDIKDAQIERIGLLMAGIGFTGTQETA